MPALHHIALATRDLVATHRFYQDLLGFPLVRVESDRDPRTGGWLKHAFYDLGDGSCVAFFELHGMGEPEEYDTAISTGLGLPFWVNHLAVRADGDTVAAVKARFDAAGVPVTMELDHGWCHSTYVTDPNGVLVELAVDTPGFMPDPDEALRLLHARPGEPSPPA